MRKLIFAIILLMSLKAIAQPILTNTSQIGYTAPIAIASAATGPTVPIGTTGANVTWNCANLVPEAGTPTVNYTVSSPAGTPYAADYPNANWHFTDPALAAIIGHTYYNLSTDSFVLWGAHVAGSAYEIYDNPQLELVFPFAYNQSVNNTYSKTNYTAAGGISSYQTGDVTLTYDGYGTLVLPNGTYNNVVRVKRVRTNNLGPTLNAYTWYSSAGERLLLYEEKDGAPVNVIYNKNVVNSTSSVEAQNNIKISSNIDTKQVTVSSFKNIEKISVYTVTGQLIESINGTQSNTLRFNVENARGLYIISVESGGQVISKKIIL